MSNHKEKFVLIPGDSENVSLHNRMNAINRIEYLSGVDLRKKSSCFRHALDHEMWVRWYRSYPKDHKIDEEWVQRAASIVKTMVDDDAKNKKASDLASQAYMIHKSEPAKTKTASSAMTYVIDVPGEISLWKKLKNWLKSRLQKEKV